MPADLRYAFGRPRGSGPVMIICPFHEDSDASLAIYHGNGFCYGCRRYLHGDEVLALAGVTEDQLPQLSETEAAALEEAAPPPSPVLVTLWHRTLVDPKSPLAHRLAWLQDRGLWLQTVERQRLGHDGRFFTIPIYDAAGTLVGVKRRRDELYCDPDTTPRYTQPKGQSALLYRPNPGGRPVAVCEGEFDALLLSQYGVDALTSTSGAESLATVLQGVRLPRTVYVLTDQDEAGDRAAAQLRDALPSRVWRRVTWEGANDVTDALRPLSDLARRETIRAWLR